MNSCRVHIVLKYPVWDRDLFMGYNRGWQTYAMVLFHALFHERSPRRRQHPRHRTETPTSGGNFDCASLIGRVPGLGVSARAQTATMREWMFLALTLSACGGSLDTQAAVEAAVAECLSATDNCVRPCPRDVGPYPLPNGPWNCDFDHEAYTNQAGDVLDPALSDRHRCWRSYDVYQPLDACRSECRDAEIACFDAL